MQPTEIQLLTLAKQVALREQQIRSCSLASQDWPVTFFALAKGERISSAENTQKKWLECLDGQLFVTSSNQKWRLTAGQALLISAETRHAYEAESDVKILEIYL